MPRLVMKFGGTSVADLARIRNVALKVKREVDRGNQVAVVLSAMAGETNKLVGWARELSPLHDAREYDTVVSSGEQVTVGLLAIALQHLGVQARSWLGWQLPIHTNGMHGSAAITGIETREIEERLAQGQVAVVAGFQGLAPDNRITTLGRGGSDTSAVALAAAIKADRCDIYTDVDGVYTTDPRVTPKARKLDKISYEEMLEMASLGAKVLQTRSVELAMIHRVRVQVLSSFEDLPGTLVCDEDEIVEQQLVSGIAYSRDEAKITLVRVPDKPGVAAAIFGPLADGGIKLLVVNLPAADLLKVDDAVKGKGVTLFNIGATDDALRAEQCRADVFHVAPSRAMLADALMQFLAMKRWTKLFLIVGPNPADQLYADALRKSAKKFGLKIVADKPWTFGPLGRDRSDSITRSDALVFSRGVDADVLVVADEANDFGNYIPFRTFEPRLVVGTQGLTAGTWHPAQDAWGSAQLQNRFLRATGRPMRATDYQAWLAVRMVGEAATRARTADPVALAKFMRSPDFSLAAFKGVPVSVRPWDQQVRQPLLIAQPLGIVSVAPEEGFLHQRTPLDTLGVDERESKCRLN